MRDRREAQRKYAASRDRTAYYKAYYAANRDRIKERNKIYYEAHADEVNAHTRRWREVNRDALNLARRLGITIKEARALRRRSLAKLSRRYQAQVEPRA